MPLHRIWQEPGDTTIKITCFAADDPQVVAQAVRVLHADGHVHKDAEWLDTRDVEAVLPRQRRFVDDCQLVGGMVVVNRDKAEARVMRDVRAVRDAALVASDVLLLRAQESDATRVEAVKTYRQRLRDFPQTLDLRALTLDELAAYHPALPAQP